ncbi:secreted antigen 1 [Babesia caballi]|uniref:Secreted antigen 1 n=1 Tax=Babesia caballi TaxID=5871 RepID=A0AAV4M2L9_BABCB|nr:secreted antigen 1 [Babesia caballi]
MTKCTGTPAPTSLKDALEFAAALSDGNLKEQVGQQLEKRVASKSWVSVEKDSVKTIFVSVVKHMVSLLKAIKSNANDYGKYSHLKTSGDHAEKCIETVVDFLPRLMARLHATLNYLWYNVDSDGGIYGRGKWKDQTANDTHSSSNDETLRSWLRGDEIPQIKPDSPFDAELPGGFNEPSKLTFSRGSELATPVRDLVEREKGSLTNLISVILVLLPSDSATTTTVIGSTIGTVGVAGLAAAAYFSNSFGIASAIATLF